MIGSRVQQAARRTRADSNQDISGGSGTLSDAEDRGGVYGEDLGEAMNEDAIGTVC